MDIFQARNSRKINTIFIFMLFTLFAAVSFSLALIGVKQYRYVTEQMSETTQTVPPRLIWLKKSAKMMFPALLPFLI